MYRLLRKLLHLFPVRPLPLLLSGRPKAALSSSPCHHQGAMKQLLSLRQFSAWVTPASGCMLVAGGTYTLLSRLVPA